MEIEEVTNPRRRQGLLTANKVIKGRRRCALSRGRGDYVSILAILSHVISIITWVTGSESGRVSCS